MVIWNIEPMLIVVAGMILHISLLLFCSTRVKEKYLLPILIISAIIIFGICGYAIYYLADIGWITLPPPTNITSALD